MDTVVVLTRKGLSSIFSEGGSGNWVANERRLAKCTYIVAVANGHSDWGDHHRDVHAQAFLVGKISGVKRAPDMPERLVIQFDEYAELENGPKAWQGQRNPVRYTNLSEFDIDPASLNWKPFPIDQIEEVDTTQPLTVEQAKRGLAKQLGVNPECIEIIVRA